MTSPTCARCDRQVADQSYVCERCAAAAAVQLARIVDLAPEVEAAIARLARFGSGGGGGRQRPLPVDLHAAERAAEIGHTVATWARHVSESRGVVVPRGPAPQEGPTCRTNTCRHLSCEAVRRRRRYVGVAAAARFLGEAHNLRWLRHRPEAAEAFEDLTAAASKLQRLVGGPLPRWYAGQCWEDLGEGRHCENELYAEPGAWTVRCRVCRVSHDTAARKDWLLEQAADTLAHAELIARALTALGLEDVTPARVRGMARHGRLLAKGEDSAGRPTYRVGDVLGVLEEQGRVEADRRRMREAKAERKAERAGQTRHDVAHVNPA